MQDPTFNAGLVWGAAVIAMFEAIKANQPLPWHAELSARAKLLGKPSSLGGCRLCDDNGCTRKCRK